MWQRIALAALAALVAALGIAAVARGTWASRVPEDPAASSEGVRTQLFLDEDGRKKVRCSAVLDYPAERVWATVTDYRRFPQIFGRVSPLADVTIDGAEPLPDGRYRLTGNVRSRLGTWPVDVKVRHTPSPERYVAAWDESRGDEVNRGSWTVVPLGPDRCRAVYLLEVRVPHYPAFVVNDVLLAELGSVVAAVRDDLARPNP
jgi:uncharacterized protein YndB with AHSA1/START domain